MSKLEEKIEDAITTYSINSGVVKKLKEITEQECIGFAEWVISQEEFEGDYTIKELFTLYQRAKKMKKKFKIQIEKGFGLAIATDRILYDRKYYYDVYILVFCFLLKIENHGK